MSSPSTSSNTMAIRLEREALSSLYDRGIDPMWCPLERHLSAARGRDPGNTLEGLIVKST